MSWNWLMWKTWVPVRRPSRPNFLMMYWPMLSARLELRWEWRGSVNTFSSIVDMCSLPQGGVTSRIIGSVMRF